MYIVCFVPLVMYPITSINHYDPIRSLRSKTTHSSFILSLVLSWGKRMFGHTRPSLCNALLREVRNSRSVEMFDPAYN